MLRRIKHLWRFVCANFPTNNTELGQSKLANFRKSGIILTLTTKVPKMGTLSYYDEKQFLYRPRLDIGNATFQENSIKSILYI